MQFTVGVVNATKFPGAERYGNVKAQTQRLTTYETRPPLFHASRRAVLLTLPMMVLPSSLGPTTMLLLSALCTL